MQGKLLAAVDIGGTKIYTVIADQNYNILAKKRFTTPAAADPQSIISEIASSVQELLKDVKAEPEDLSAAGICVAGYYDWQRKILCNSPNLPQLNNLPLEEVIAKELGVPVLVENDANAAAVGETHFGAGKGFRDVIFVTVSTGIGSGLVLDGRLYRGSHGFSGEIGHMTVQPGGLLCGCGRHGCLETVSSGKAMACSAREAIKRGEKTVLAKAANRGGRITAAEVFAAAAEGDQVAAGILDDAIRYLGLCLVNTINLLNPAVIIVGGGVAEAGEAFFLPLQAIIAGDAMACTSDPVLLKKAELGAEAGVFGMLCLLKEHLRICD